MATSSAFANLLVSPTRVVVSESERVVNLTLRHMGDKPQTYRVSFVFYKMNPNGNLERVTAPPAGERSAIGLLRMSPKQTRLAPKLEQVVRVMAVPKANLGEGEYRAHINFEPISDDAEEGAREVASPTKGISATIEVQTAISIPVIYRKGKPTFQTSLTKPRLIREKDKSMVSVDLVTKGRAFPYGNFVALFTPEGSRESKKVGELRGVPGYLASQNVTFAVGTPGSSLGKGTLNISYQDAENPELKPFATVDIKLN